MRNIPNMSYCAFENTESAINQLIEMVSTAVDEDCPLDMSMHERRAYNRLRDAMGVLADLMEAHNEMEASEEHLDDED